MSGIGGGVCGLGVGLSEGGGLIGVREKWEGFFGEGFGLGVEVCGGGGG